MMIDADVCESVSDIHESFAGTQIALGGVFLRVETPNRCGGINVRTERNVTLMWLNGYTVR